MATIAHLDPQLDSELKQSESNDLLPSQEDDSSSDKASETELCLSCLHDNKKGPSAMIKCCSCMQCFHPACCGKDKKLCKGVWSCLDFLLFFQYIPPL